MNLNIQRYTFQKLDKLIPHFLDLKKCYIKTMQKIKIEQHSVTGGMWFAAWLFTIGILDLTFWRGVLALILWPYFLGQALTGLI